MTDLDRAVLPDQCLLQVETVVRDTALPGVYQEPGGSGAHQVGVGPLQGHGARVTAQHSVHQGR